MSSVTVSYVSMKHTSFSENPKLLASSSRPSPSKLPVLRCIIRETMANHSMRMASRAACIYASKLEQAPRGRPKATKG